MDNPNALLNWGTKKAPPEGEARGATGSADTEVPLGVPYLCRQDVLLGGVALASLVLKPEILELKPRIVEAVFCEQISEAGVSDGVHELDSEVNKPQCTVVLRH